MAAPRFWDKPLGALTPQEWEALCDGCGKCCLVKLRCDETETVHFTDVACKLLDGQSCRCSNYPERRRLVPDCVVLDAGSIGEIDWLPTTCAYRKLAEGQNLDWWHWLISGDPETVHSAGVSVRGRIFSELAVPESALEDHLVDWPEAPGPRRPQRPRRRSGGD